jgi:hypothetical protein
MGIRSAEGDERGREGHTPTRFVIRVLRRRPRLDQRERLAACGLPPASKESRELRRHLASDEVGLHIMKRLVRLAAADAERIRVFVPAIVVRRRDLAQPPAYTSSWACHGAPLSLRDSTEP